MRGLMLGGGVQAATRSGSARLSSNAGVSTPGMLEAGLIRRCVV